MMMVKILKYLMLVFSAGGPLWGADKPNFNELIKKVIAKVEADSSYIGDNYLHKEEEKTETFKNGVISEVSVKTYQVEKRGKDLYRKLILRDGIVFSGSQFQKKEPLIEIGARLLSRYDFTFQRTEEIENKKFFVFSFKPKTSLPETNDKNSAFNKAAGEIWVAENNLTLKRMAVNLMSEASVSLKKIGTVKIQKLNCLVDTKLIDGRFAVSSVWVEYLYSASFFRVPFINDKHEIKNINYKDYERRKQ